MPILAAEMPVVLDIAPTISHRWTLFPWRDPDSRLGFTVCGIRFAWAEPRKGQRAARCKACWG
ncbi:MAG TPA: hypothetical protein VII01_03950 [Solirubrobacteraceae bacterium]